MLTVIIAGMIAGLQLGRCLGILTAAARHRALAWCDGGLRADGRRRTSARRARITLGSEWGEAEVTLDKTRALAVATVEAVSPAPERPGEGTVQILVELSPGSSEEAARDAAGMRSALNDRGADLRSTVERILRESRAIDTEALCIVAGAKVWAVQVVIDVLDDDGNSVDAAMLAASAALLHARHPDVTVSGRDVIIHSLDEREPIPLPIHHIPVASTFALFPATDLAEPDAVVLDPTRREEHSSKGSITLAFNAQGEVCAGFKAGGAPIDPVVFVECAKLASGRAIEVTNLLSDAMKDAASQHPMATIRPVLSNPEPVAVLESDPIGAVSRPAKGIGGAWNATPVPDTAPPRAAPMDIVNGRSGLSDKQKAKLVKMGQKSEDDDVIEESDGVLGS